MREKRRTNCLLLAVLMAFAFTALAGHFAVHPDNGAAQCVTCTLHLDPHGAATAWAIPFTTVHERGPVVPPVHTPKWATDSLATPRQRAPPANS